MKTFNVDLLGITVTDKKRMILWKVGERWLLWIDAQPYVAVDGATPSQALRRAAYYLDQAVVEAVEVEQ